MQTPRLILDFVGIQFLNLFTNNLFSPLFHIMFLPKSNDWQYFSGFLVLTSLVHSTK
jgi:hypothetical protein